MEGDKKPGAKPSIYKNSFESQKFSEDNPHKVKYSTGYGSVKGLHYRKYISLELLSENNFSLTFHKFYSNEIKNLIRSISSSKFSPELRTWVMSLLHYE